MSTQQSTALAWTNWVGNQTFTPASLRVATSENEVAEIVTEAAAHGIGARTFGTGHSFTPIVETEGVLIDTSAMRGILHIDTAARQVITLPKTTIGEFGEPLWEQGLALANQGDIDTQAIAGAIATATHGSGKRLPNFSAALAGARFVDGMGNLVEVSKDENAEVLPALQTSMGLLGIMTRLTLNVAPAYTLHSRHTVMPYTEVMEHFDEFVETYRHFSFFWMPTDASAKLYLLKNARADDCVVKLYREATPEIVTQSLPPNEQVGRPYQIYPMRYDPNFHEVEYFLPLEHARDIIAEMRKLMRRWVPLSIYPLEVRMVAADEAWMSPNYRRTNLVISISGQPGTDYWPYLHACDSLFAEFEGRPHWGKLHFMTADRLARRFPRYEDFVRMRQRFDPKGTFLNAFTRPLFA